MRMDYMCGEELCTVILINFRDQEIRTRFHLDLVLSDLGLDFYDPLSIIKKTQGRMAEDKQWIRIWYFCPDRHGDTLTE